MKVGLLCASEFALAIALTVFILLTVILAVLLICLAASKNFRTVFFREKSRKKKSTKKQQAVSEPAPTIPHGGVDTIPIDPPKTARRTSTRKTADDDGTPEFLNAIPTVPLGGFPQATPTPRGKSRQSGMRITEIPDTVEQGGAYTPRAVTITRARPSTPTKVDNKTDKNDKNKTDKAEAAKPARTTKRDKK